MIGEVTTTDLAGDGAWRELRARLRPFVAKRVQPADVEDVLQEVFLRIQQNLPALRDDQRFGPWVYRIARSAVVDHLRTSARHPLTDRLPEAQEDSLQQTVTGLHASDTGSDDENEQGVEQDVARYAALLVSLLPSPYREALTLTELSGLTQAEAAQMLGISLSGMKSRVQRGRRKLRTALQDCCHIVLDARRHVIDCQPRTASERRKDCCS